MNRSLPDVTPAFVDCRMLEFHCNCLKIFRLNASSTYRIQHLTFLLYCIIYYYFISGYFSPGATFLGAGATCGPISMETASLASFSDTKPTSRSQTLHTSGGVDHIHHTIRVTNLQQKFVPRDNNLLSCLPKTALVIIWHGQMFAVNFCPMTKLHELVTVVHTLHKQALSTMNRTKYMITNVTAYTHTNMIQQLYKSRTCKSIWCLLIAKVLWYCTVQWNHSMQLLH